MSSDNEDRSSKNHDSDTRDDAQKHSKVSYTREFLLSLSQLEICKKLPSGFDQPILSEFEDLLTVTLDQRIPGSLPSQGFRRNDYSSSPPTRGDSNYSRGIFGRWESRSSGRSDRDSDSQSERDPDAGRRYGNQTRRTWQSSEHDGLLGSGSFPRPSYASGTSAPKARASDNYQLNKTNEPYHPPRPYKAVPHSRRETDAINDETFGSIESASEDRVEEERKRRASFELMRKEQQKVLQEKQKPNVEKHTAEYATDIPVLQEDNKEDRRLLDRNTEVDMMASQPFANNDCGKSSFSSQNLSSRPLVPPGFKTTALAKNSGSKTLKHSQLTEIGKPESEESLLETKANTIQNDIRQSIERQSSEISSSDQPECKSLHASILKKNGQIVNLSVSPDVSDGILGMKDHLRQTSSFLEAHKALNEPEIIELSTRHSGGKIVEESNPIHSTSILDKIFGSAIAIVTNSETPVKLDRITQNKRNSTPGDTLSSKAPQSSKFAQWFSEEERKPVDDSSSSGPSDLLALIVGGDKNRLQTFEANSECLPSEFSYQSPEPTNKLASSLPSAPLGGSEPVYKSSKREAAPAILTCEDLEHTMLSEFCEKIPNSQPQGWSTNHSKTEEPVNVDNQASQHLLSLLQKGPDLRSFTQKTNAGIESFDAPDEITLQDRSKKEDTKDIHASGKTLTLETLFGTAFMNELQSAQAPVSVQRSSVGSGLNDALETRKPSLSGSDDRLFPSMINDIGHRVASNENMVLPPNHRDQPKLNKAENWLGLDDSLYEVNYSKRQNEMVSNKGDYGAREFHLPEEQSLISVGDPLKPQASMFMPAGTMSKGDLATVAGGDERSLVGPGALPFPRGSYDQMEPEMPFHHRRAQPSSPQFQPLQMSQGMPLLHPLGSRPAHLNSQFFTGPEGMTRRDAHPGHQFAGNMMRPPFHHPNAGVTGFDLNAHHPMLQQMRMSGNHPPHPLHDRLRGAPVPSHPSNQAAGFVQEVNTMQGFHFAPHQVNANGLGMQMPVPDINNRNNHPEAIQKLIEMELRASKQLAAARGQGMYGHELDMGLRYR